MKRISRRDFLKSTGYAAGATLLASCAPAPEPTKPAATMPAAAATTASQTGPATCKFKQCKLTVPSWWAPHEIASAEKSFSGSFKQQTGLDVKYEYIPAGAEFNTKVFTNLAGDTPYDALTFNASNVPVYLAKGALLPLNDYISRDKLDTSNIDASALDQWTHDGKIYGLSADMGSYHCYFNYDLFEKAGIKPPKPTEEWTWAQLKEWAKALTIKKGDQIVQYGLVMAPNIDVFAGMNNTITYEPGLTKARFDDPKVIEAFEFYAKMVHEDGSTMKVGAVQTTLQDIFLSGGAAIMVNGTWQVGYLRSKKADMKYKWDVGMLPHNGASPDFWVPNFTAGWSIPKNAKDPNASWEAIKYYASDTFAKEVMFTGLSGLPVTKTVLNGAWYAQWPENPPEGLTKDFYALMLKRGKPVQTLKFDLGADINAAIKKLDLIYSGQEKPAKVLTDLNKELNTLLADRPWNKK